MENLDQDIFFIPENKDWNLSIEFNSVEYKIKRTVDQYFVVREIIGNKISLYLLEKKSAKQYLCKKYQETPQEEQAILTIRGKNYNLFTVIIPGFNRNSMAHEQISHKHGQFEIEQYFDIFANMQQCNVSIYSDEDVKIVDFDN